ncbi:MAG: hypothetical protein KA369_18560 [Spirochaetes bacterium]|nr:hypothetical protein [Spirochaetota bacterium]
MEANTSEQYDVPLSRIPLFLLFLIGLLFLVVGLDLGLFHVIFPYFSIDPEKKLIFYAFLLFAVGCGGAIVAQMLLYLAKPPVMFRVSTDGISFGTGFRYTLFTIPWKYVDSVSFGVEPTKLIANKQIMAGLQIAIANSPDIPSSKPTSIGVLYVFNCLTLSWIYMGRPTGEVRDRIIEMKKKHG